MKKTGKSDYSAVRFWFCSLPLRGKEKYFIVAFVSVVIGITYFNEFLVLGAASRRQRGSLPNHIPARKSSSPGLERLLSAAAPSRGRQSSSLLSMSPDALFHRLHQLLTTTDPAARAGCPHTYGAGGRCFLCVPVQNGMIRSWIDGRKDVCLNLLQPNCSVLSFGINHDFSFEEVMEDLGCTVHAFDPTMGVNSHRRSKGIHFHSLGIGASDTNLGGFPVASLGSIARRARLQTGVIDYMKLDVETSEWEALHQQLTTSGDLLRVRQLNIEFHLFQWSPQLANGYGMRHPDKVRVLYENAVRFVAVLEALRRAGFELLSGSPNISCQKYDGGCLSYLYDTHWVNMKINVPNVA